ncbi:MAG: lipocalin family protein [Coriobacteriia bacterium]|nr:lipocalin family protein [Coriobacteriia bacterium]
MSKTINKIIGIAILAIALAVLAFALCGCNHEKKVVGNWHLISFTENAEAEDLFGNDIEIFKKKNIEQDKVSVFTFREDKTFEHSIFGKLVSGTYSVKGDDLKIIPTSENKGNLKETTFKIQGDKILSNLGGEFERHSISALENNKQVRRQLGLSVVDLSFYLAGIEGVSSDQVVAKLEALESELSSLSDAEKNQALKEVESQYYDKLLDAYNKLDDKQKEKVSILGQLLKFRSN